MRIERLEILPILFITATMLLDFEIIKLEHGILLTSFAASTFILFMNEKKEENSFMSAHLIGLTCGIIFSILARSSIIGLAFASALSVASTSLLMHRLHIEHPPANGTSLGVVINPLNTNIILSVLSTLILLYIMYNAFLYLRKNQ